MRLFTIDDANAEIPRLGALIERMQRSALVLDRERLECAAGHGGEEITPAVLLRERPAARRAADELQGVMTEIQRLGVQLKDVELGLVDFPSEHAGRPRLLCWQYGEPAVAYWHGRDEGFAARKPLAGTHARPPLQ
jgi:hypothetical protein